MYVTKCDVCGKEIEKGAAVLHFGYQRMLPSKMLCEDCAAPIIPILRRMGLIREAVL
jgi:hypothetical protein